MSAVARLAPIVLLVGTLQLVLTPQARGEIVEEIVAWVDGDIITKSDLERQEGDLTLLDMIDRKILHRRGRRLWGSEEIEESYYRNFLQQQGLSDGEEIERLLAPEGLTVEDLKRRLSEKFLPDQVIEHEVALLVPGISDVEARDYYDGHPDEFMAPDERLMPFDESIDRARKALHDERYREQLELFLQGARAAAEWWVKSEYRDHLPKGVKPTREEAPW